MLIYLQPEASGQTIYLSLGEHFKIKGDEFTYFHMRLTHLVSKEELTLMLNIQTLNERYAEALVDTTQNDYTAGAVLLNVAGMYKYEVFCNTDLANETTFPSENNRVLFTQGLCHVLGQEGHTFDNETYPQGIIYNQ